MRLALMLALSAFTLAGCAGDRDVVAPQPIAKALSSPEYRTMLEGVDYYYGNQRHPAIEKSYGERKTSRRSNAAKNGNDFACERAFVTALVRLKRVALKLGGNAIVNIKSNYKNHEVSSETHYQCKPGTLMSGVALKGTVVKLRK